MLFDIRNQRASERADVYALEVLTVRGTCHHFKPTYVSLSVRRYISTQSPIVFTWGPEQFVNGFGNRKHNIPINTLMVIPFVMHAFIILCAGWYVGTSQLRLLPNIN